MDTCNVNEPLLLMMVRCCTIAGCLMLLLWRVGPARGQPEIVELLEQMAAEDAELDVDRILDLAESPMNLNTATRDDLMRIPMLSPSVIAALLDAREERSLFESYAVLDSIPALDEQTIAWIRIFTDIPARDTDQPKKPSRVEGFIRSRFTRRLDTGRGYVRQDGVSTYLGGPTRHLQRIRLRAGNMEANLTLDKMPGERHAWDPGTRRFGFAFSSYYARIENPSGRLRRVIVGDFVVDEGYGLGLGASLFGGKGRESVRGITRRGSGIREIGSSMRSSYNRGAAASLVFGDNLVLNVFHSRRYRDARVDSVIIDGIVAARARGISTADLHRTNNETVRRRALHEVLSGITVNYARRVVSLGSTIHYVTYNPPLLPADRDDLKPLNERARQAVVSVHADVKGDRFTAFGEVATTDVGVRASIVGFQFSASEVEALILHRHYPSSYDNPFARAFGHQSGANRNETGIYVGIRARLSESLRVRAYLDDVRFPWLRFGRHLPTTMTDAMVDIEYRPRRWWTSALTLRSRVEGVTSSGRSGRALPESGEAKQTSLRVDHRISASPNWRVQFRAEVVGAHSDGGPRGRGILLFQDATWQASRGVSISVRHMMFDTDDAIRMYAYERDLSSAFGMVSVGGRGRRSYVVTSLRPSQKYLFQAKFGATTYTDVESIGSGNDEVEGNRLREIRLQVQVRI